MRGTVPIRSGQPRLVGHAFTLRFIPAREDLATPQSWAKPVPTRGAIEAMPEGCIVVADAMGVTDAGIFGDILCARMENRGVAGLVTDGVMRDMAGVLGTGLPVWCRGAAAPPSVAGLTFVNWQEPVGCGGVAVFPDDVVVVDDDGAVLIPAALVDEVVATAPEQELLEAWIMQEVENGSPLPGLYPPTQKTRRGTRHPNGSDGWRSGNPWKGSHPARTDQCPVTCVTARSLASDTCAHAMPCLRKGRTPAAPS